MGCLFQKNKLFLEITLFLFVLPYCMWIGSLRLNQWMCGIYWEIMSNSIDTPYAALFSYDSAWFICLRNTKKKLKQTKWKISYSKFKKLKCNYIEYLIRCISSKCENVPSEILDENLSRLIPCSIYH